MRTLGFMSEHKRRIIGEETLEIYAPLAHRLGIHWIKQEMEDLVFSYLETDAYKALMSEMQGRLGVLNQTRERLESLIQQALSHQGLKAKVQGRMKHLYSIHEKMQRKHVDFEEIFDLLAFRVIVEDMTMCYQALGVVHSLYRPVPGRFKDYIAIPKPNGYQSLHTVVIGPENFRIEVQIRTEAMHFYAEDGVAAHWVYKKGGSSEEQDSYAWLKQLTDLLKETDNPGEMLEDVRLDLFVREVYVFSRDGDIYPLPRGARPLDFAYAVHTDIGQHCVGVRINGEVADFSCRLKNGDQIEVMTSPDQTPSRQWLQYVKTPRAKQAIRQWFRRQESDSSLRLGEKILYQSLGMKDVSVDILKECNCEHIDELKVRLGRGELAVHTLLAAAPQQEGRSLLKLIGMQNASMQAAECCHPIPGDMVLGQLNGNEGMVLHHFKCSIVREANKDEWVEVDWQRQSGQLFKTGIEVRSRNQRGMLANVTRCIADSASSIEDLKLNQRGGSVTVLLFLIEVEDRVHLARVMRAIKAVEGVVKVERRNAIGLSSKRESRALGETLRDFFAGRKMPAVKSTQEKE